MIAKFLQYFYIYTGRRMLWMSFAILPILNIRFCYRIVRQDGSVLFLAHSALKTEKAGQMSKYEVPFLSF